MSDYKTVLLKLSGEMLAGAAGHGLDQAVLDAFAGEIAAAARAGVRLGVVIGGGNIFRGLSVAATGMNRSRADHMGMLATVINALAMQDALERLGVEARVFSAVRMDTVAEPCLCREAVRHLDQGRVVIFGGGTGNPFFSTDSGAALRAAEIGADLLLKGTKVDGIYDKDPARHPDAVRFERLTHMEVLSRGLRVMDLTATALCRDNQIPVVVYDASVPGNLARVLAGEQVGTRVDAH
ncbi:MAG: UMP kinase [Deltaproteobacteria bacterium]|nr:UMP kinase [Deltaproteobacteria bacterium]